ncbi:extracellular solute-binding protein [Lutimaribacter sp. EGI FJ00015]|uniref:Extracellular solute-binding protein n=1 Tax=Lutimaribacter degradans TaxID=2945989 RepID=A0ACC5ZT24_9RHOB|nr:extracellular solute-binding protein [Lutimaribacter sp. EGI FJ00013]MCM2561181.1 extracellular solute-binding protein [Lutimaribacter sp. EGI FJ00013]MCO0611870.1 extracellular solute-binding protein [Lutimaribacter sp. EGI FJ00015]MCO0635009.1 extracellular solute-binding protein [Lutimaribacter sp. EGI FJ00014]
MRPLFFRPFRLSILLVAFVFLGVQGFAQPSHGIAMYGEPALPPDFTALPYANPDAPTGGRLIEGNTGGFDSLNPFLRKGTVPWQLRFYAYESLMARNWDEPFTLYGLLAESVETGPDRTWVEFTLRDAARFSDGSPVTAEDVIWSFETLGTSGHPRYLGFWTRVEKIEQTGPGKVRLTFNEANRELALIAGLRPILNKAQWQGRDFTAGGIEDIPLGTGPYVVDRYETGRLVVLRRNPDYWGADLPIRRGTANLDEIRIEFFGDENVMFEAFKAGVLNFYREPNADRWATQYDFRAVRSGEIVKSEIRHQRPSGMTGFVMNTRRPQLADWRVRQALILAFNFPYINETITGGRQPRITSYFSNSELGMRNGPAQGAVRDLLAPFADALPPGALEGITLPEGDPSPRNRGDLRRAVHLLAEAGWTVQNGVLRNADGTALRIEAVLRQGDKRMESVLQIYSRALERLGIGLTIRSIDNAQFTEREANTDFDLMPFRRDLSLSPGNEQRLYWGSDNADIAGTRNLMGVKIPAVDAMIDALLTAKTPERFNAAARALDRALMAGRFVIPTWTTLTDRVAHAKNLRFPEKTPIYGDRIGWMPDVWWSEPNE